MLEVQPAEQEKARREWRKLSLEEREEAIRNVQLYKDTIRKKEHTKLACNYLKDKSWKKTEKTRETERKIRTPKRRIQILRNRIQIPKSRIQKVRNRIQTSKYRIQKVRSRIQIPKYRIQKVRNRIQIPENRIQKVRSRIQATKET